MENDGVYYFGSEDTVIPCIQKAWDRQHTYSNIVTCLANRTLKLLQQMLWNKVILELELETLFNEIDGICQQKRLTESHKLTQLRLESIKRELRK